MGRFDHRNYVSLTMEFRCNLKCEHCMIEGTMDRLVPESDAKFEEMLAFNERERRWTGVILTGSEITLRRDLPELARRARARGLDHVRIQTHGMGLARREYVDELVASGVDEYFVSVAAHDAETHDGITQVPGSFAKTLAGLENLEAHDGVVSLTNTVVTERSFRTLPDVVDRLAHLKKLVQMEFWFYWPMSPVDDKDLLVSHLEALPYLKQAIAKARALGRDVEVKNFPVCLLGDEQAAVHNDQPLLQIDPAFWPEFHKNGFHQCAYRQQCGSKQCLGLNTAYVAKFGWHEDVLRPLPREP